MSFKVKNPSANELCNDRFGSPDNKIYSGAFDDECDEMQNATDSLSNIAICVQGLSKCYEIYNAPHDRLKQFIMPRLMRFVGQQPTQYFREFWALKDVSFEIKKGETVGIIGRNGSGKSTLLQLICGTLSPTNGWVKNTGRIAALLELGSGFNPDFTGRENVYLYATILGLCADEIKERFDDIAEFADIGQFIEQPVKTYSSGMIVRLAFAVAINVDPEILIVDEALSVGDELFQRKCFSRIEAIKKNGATILFVSHSAGTVVELCDRALLMESGEKLLMGVPKQIVEHYQKLLYAPDENRDFVCEQIRRIGDFASNAVSKDERVEKQHLSIERSQDDCCEGFDPNLKPRSSMDYESHGVQIQLPQLFTLSGEPVNQLVRGKQYRYFYKVFFDRKAESVRFGMLIKSTSGLALGGAISASSQAGSIPIVKPGQYVTVEFVFNCYLNPGVYFMNAGVLGRVGREETFLHRRIDVIAFRVMPVKDNISTEFIHFSCNPLVRIDE